jgi:hypothetical protein
MQICATFAIVPPYGMFCSPFAFINEEDRSLSSDEMRFALTRPMRTPRLVTDSLMVFQFRRPELLSDRVGFVRHVYMTKSTAHLLLQAVFRRRLQQIRRRQALAMALHPRNTGSGLRVLGRDLIAVIAWKSI